MVAQLHSTIALGQLLPADIPCDGYGEIPVTSLTMDSRKVTNGAVFLAVKGWKQDGRQFIAQAVANGCVAVIAEAEAFAELYPAASAVMQSLEKAGVPLIQVTGLQSRVSWMAANFYGHPARSMDVVGVTGTNGKTTCTWLLAQLGHLLGYSAGVIGTLGWGTAGQGAPALQDTGMTTPDAISLQETLDELRLSGVNLLAMEVSSHGLEQRRVDAANIRCAILTNLSRDHLDYHGSEQRYAEAKTRLFTLPSVTQAIINIDDNLGAKIHGALPEEITGVSYGLSSAADVYATEITPTDDGVAFVIHSPWGEGRVESKLVGEFNVLNLMAVISAFCLRDVALNKILALVRRLEPVPGRMQIVSRQKLPRVIVDYSHTPDALMKALTASRQYCRGQLWCVFGCGGDRDFGKRPEMGAIAEKLADYVVLTSDNPRSEEPQAIIDQILVGMTVLKNVRVLANRKQAIETAIAGAGADDCVLVAGKGHENYQQIGDRKLPFSDMEIARAALEARDPAGRGGAP